jgi:hypothetical protein
MLSPFYCTISNIFEYHAGFTEEIWDISFKLWNSKSKVFVTFAPFAIVLVVFVAFIIWNGGIVLGKPLSLTALHLCISLGLAVH